MTDSFDDMGIAPDLTAGPAELDWDAPTALQKDAIPVIRRGNNVVLHASTGSGVIGAYGLGVLDRLLESSGGSDGDEGPTTRAVVLTADTHAAGRTADALARLAAPTADPQQPLNSWVLELPIVHGERQDNLQLRIDQYRGGADGNAAQRQWTVDLAFDLHASGKLQVQLKILGSSVAGTLWTEREALHRQARAHLDDLRRGLESAGVQVSELTCHQGLPEQRGPRWQQQLVDLKT